MEIRNSRRRNVSVHEKTQGKKWFLLAAGSNGWENYRHQADVCHAYQVVHRNGILDDQIVVMMYDDIANNDQNPKRGKIFNEPDGPDVYEGVQKDYTGNDVSAENFLAVLRGDSAAVSQTTGTKKLIQSGKNDTVFIYLSDHGGNGIFKFPNSTLYACDLIETVRKMSTEHKFAKMVIYLEACRSGSMLNALTDNNVYGVAACWPDESSYSFYYDTSLNACLSDVFTAFWLHHTERVNLNMTSFGDQFNYLKKNVSQYMKRRGKSQTPCNYGDKNICQIKLSEFLGESCGLAGGVVGPSGPSNLLMSSVVEATEIPLRILENSITREKVVRRKEILQRRYDNFKRKRTAVDEAMQKIATYLKAPEAVKEKREVTRMYELKMVAEHFKINLFNWEKEPMVVTPAHLQVLVNLCERRLSTETINDVITRVSNEVTF